jgi:ribosome biogenesis GTP-binding protein YsxC/EngB
MNPIYHRAEYLISAPSLRHLPEGILREVAFAGRSNAGKSSAINAITQRRGLARISKTPGRTQQMNVFALTDEVALVDLPGYGYAKVNDAMRAQWRRALPEYLRKRQALQGVMLIMDIRHPLTEHDLGMLALVQEANLPVHVLLSKADKLGRGAGLEALRKVQRALAEISPMATAQLFSATTRLGIDEAHAKLDAWLFPQAEKNPELVGDDVRG